MKVSDIVRVHDGSFNMSLIKGRLQHVTDVAKQGRCFRVHGVSGMYPTNRTHGESEINDILLVDIKDPDFVLFTQERFCTVVTSPLRLRPDEVKVVIPRGTKEVHLVLQ